MITVERSDIERMKKKTNIIFKIRETFDREMHNKIHENYTYKPYMSVYNKVEIPVIMVYNMLLHSLSPIQNIDLYIKEKK